MHNDSDIRMFSIAGKTESKKLRSRGEHPGNMWLCGSDDDSVEKVRESFCGWVGKGMEQAVWDVPLPEDLMLIASYQCGDKGQQQKAHQDGVGDFCNCIVALDDGTPGPFISKCVRRWDRKAKNEQMRDSVAFN